MVKAEVEGLAGETDPLTRRRKLRRDISPTVRESRLGS